MKIEIIGEIDISSLSEVFYSTIYDLIMQLRE